MSYDVDYLVIGGGIVGLCAATALRMRGFSVAVLEASGLSQATPDATQRIYAINHASQALLQNLEVWALIPFSCQVAYQRMCIWDSAQQASIDFDARMIARDRLGVMLEEFPLKSALLQRVKDLDIRCVSDWKTKAIDIQASAIHLYSYDEHWCAQTLIVADGAHSYTRELLGVETITWSYHQQAIVAKVAVEQPHQCTAYQIFSAQGPLAFLPMANSHECGIVWSTSTENAECLLQMSSDEFEQQLMQVFQHRLGQVKLRSPRKMFPLHMQHVKQYTGPRWVIMGDAAHTIHPMAGLGLNIGLEDINQWLNLIPPQSKRMPTGQQLKYYQRQRKHALWQMIAFLQGLHILFGRTDLPSRLLRGVGLMVCDRLSVVKRALIEHAIGVYSL